MGNDSRFVCFLPHSRKQALLCMSNNCYFEFYSYDCDSSLKNLIPIFYDFRYIGKTRFNFCHGQF